MAPVGAQCERSPLTNRGVELAKASSSGAWMTDRGPHDSGFGPLGPGVEVTQHEWQSTDP